MKKNRFLVIAPVVMIFVLSSALSLKAQETRRSPGEESEWKTMESEKEFKAKKKSSGAPSSPKGIKIDQERGQEHRKIVTDKIRFQVNSDQPTAQSLAVLKRLAQFLNQKPDLNLRIEGHSDSVGSDQANLEISQRRADRVKEVLVQEGVAADRLMSVGMGDKTPLMSSVTLEGQEKNRRVEFHIVGGLITKPQEELPAPPIPSAEPEPTAPTPPPETAPSEPAPPETQPETRPETVPST